MASDLETGLLVGLLIGEGHFGGDGKQPHVTLRMNIRHESLFRWIERTFPGGRLYGPYHHGGRHYFQWMARGTYLREVLVPVLREHLTAATDDYAFGRLQDMCDRYASQLGTPTGGDGQAEHDPPNTP
jgi:hypothetical protein